MKKVNVAILGSGKIGIDLACKVLKSDKLNCIVVASRDMNSEGLIFAKEKGFCVSDRGIEAILEVQDKLDVVFDATNAMAHIEHWRLLEDTNIKVIDMTPAKIGRMIVPSVNIQDSQNEKNLNMISCGGQSSIPLMYELSRLQKGISYMEVVSSIASLSAGLSTRINIDEYVHTTEEAIKKFTGVDKAKVILILNPANPPVCMQTTISLLVDEKEIDIDNLVAGVKKKVQEIKKYVPGYELVVEPRIDGNRIVLMIKVVGSGDYIPPYAGNLDIINCAAISVAENMF